MGSCFSWFERTHPHDQEETADDAEVDHEAEAIFRLALAVINVLFFFEFYFDICWFLSFSFI